MREDLTPDERITLADAQLDQLIATVTNSAHKDLYTVQHLTQILAVRPCNVTADNHTHSLASMLALALFRFAKEENRASASI